MNWKQVPVPNKMKELEKDRRGYPIPYGIVRDDNGHPHFQISDVDKIEESLIKKLCIICGHSLGLDIWMAGGPLSAFHSFGGYIDPPVHKECGQYAMQVCPYLAVSIYKKRSGVTTPTNKNFSGNANVIATVIPGKPPFFVLAKTLGYHVVRPNPHDRYIVPIRPFLEIECWKDGAQITLHVAQELLREHNNFTNNNHP